MIRLSLINALRSKLFNGGVSIGSWMQIPHPSIAEIMGQGGYDWVAVDLEHGAIALHQLPDIFRALELGGTLPLVRIARSDPKDCKQVLDAGAGGVIVPMIESAEQLLEVRNACRWPPAGTRGVGFSRSNLFGRHFETYKVEAQAPILVAMIEHRRAVENLDDILAVDGLDAIMIGPYDLSASMNLTAEFAHSDYLNITAEILRKCNDAGVAAGVHVVQPSRDDLKSALAEGHRFIAFSIDAVFIEKASRLTSKSVS